MAKRTIERNESKVQRKKVKRSNGQGEDTRGPTYRLYRKLDIDLKRELENQTYKTIHVLLELLRRNSLNIATAESLTAGMIAKMLVDFPTYGANVYGGFVVYDTDAKRIMINVSTPNVYSDETARQMSKGTLDNTRAMVALAVTGQAGPTPSGDEDAIGIVDMSCSIRTSGGMKNWFTKTQRLNVLKDFRHRNPEIEKMAKNWIRKWKKQQQSDIGKCLPRFGSSCSKITTLSAVRDVIRIITVEKACRLAIDTIESFLERKLSLGKLRKMSWDDQEPYNRCAYN